MSVAVNPTNPLNLVGISHHLDYDDVARADIDVYHSTDGGATWSNTVIDAGADDELGFGNRFDPTITFDTEGRLFIGYGFWDSTGTLSVVVGRSQDGGATFDQFKVVQSSPGSTFLPALDKWYLASGLDPDSGTEAVYIAYTQNAPEVSGTDSRIVVSGSRDGGASWTTPLIINDTSIAGTSANNLFAGPAVGPNGELYVAWHRATAGQLLLDRDLVRYPSIVLMGLLPV
jgi:hypothetical protein